MTSYNRGPYVGGFQERIRSIAQNYKFYVEIGGVLVGEFLECGGLVLEREVHEIHEGGVNDYSHKRPGKLKLTNITLKRGLTYDRELLDWFRRGMYDGMVKRKNMSIIIGNADFLKVKQWDVFGAFPVKWELAALNASTMEIAWEQIELAHNGFTLSAVEGTPIGSGLMPDRAAALAAATEAAVRALADVANNGPDNGALAALAARAAAAQAALEAERNSEKPDPDALKALADRAAAALAALEAAGG